jgi:hypothetical protein
MVEGSGTEAAPVTLIVLTGLLVANGRTLTTLPETDEKVPDVWCTVETQRVGQVGKKKR